MFSHYNINQKFHDILFGSTFARRWLLLASLTLVIVEYSSIRLEAFSDSLAGVEGAIFIQSSKSRHKYNVFVFEKYPILGTLSVGGVMNNSDSSKDYGFGIMLSGKLLNNKSDTLKISCAVDLSCDNINYSVDFADKLRREYLIYNHSIKNDYSMGCRVNAEFLISEAQSSLVYGFLGIRVGRFRTELDFDNDDRDPDPVNIRVDRFLTPAIFAGIGFKTSISNNLNMIAEISHTNYRTINLPSYNFYIDGGNMVVKTRKFDISNFAFKFGFMMKVGDLSKILS